MKTDWIDIALAVVITLLVVALAELFFQEGTPAPAPPHEGVLLRVTVAGRGMCETYLARAGSRAVAGPVTIEHRGALPPTDRWQCPDVPPLCERGVTP